MKTKNRLSRLVVALTALGYSTKVYYDAAEMPERVEAVRPGVLLTVRLVDDSACLTLTHGPDSVTCHGCDAPDPVEVVLGFAEKLIRLDHPMAFTLSKILAAY